MLMKRLFPILFASAFFNCSPPEVCAQGREGRNNAVQVLHPPTLEEVLKKIRENPEEAYWHNQAAVLYGARDNLEDALREIRIAIGLEPENPINYDFLASFLEEKGSGVEAEEALRSALALDQNNPSLHYDFGKILEGRRDWQAALAEYFLAQENLFRAERGPTGLVYYDAFGNVYSLDGLADDIKKGIERIRKKLREEAPEKKRVLPKCPPGKQCPLKQ